jgi:hypothetical protein
LYSSSRSRRYFFWFSSMDKRLSIMRWEMDRTSKRTFTMSRVMSTVSRMEMKRVEVVK